MIWSRKPRAGAPQEELHGDAGCEPPPSCWTLTGTNLRGAQDECPDCPEDFGVCRDLDGPLDPIDPRPDEAESLQVSDDVDSLAMARSRYRSVRVAGYAQTHSMTRG
jgi:hypothetical protein